MIGTTSSRARWVDSLGKPHTWSKSALAVSLVVSTVVFVFGNVTVAIQHPVVTVGTNTVLTLTVFVLARLVASAVAGRRQASVAGVVTLFSLVALSAGRGAALHGVAVFLDVPGEQSVWMRMVVSVTVFLPGILLSVLVVASVRQWRADEARISELTEQLVDTRRSISATIEAHTREVGEQVKAHLEPRLAAMATQGPQEVKEALREMVTTVVKPLSNTLHHSFPTITLPPPRTVSVAVRQFFKFALGKTPLAPILTGIIFGLTLLPRFVSAGPLTTALAWAVVVSVVMALGAWAINLLSEAFLRQLALTIHASIVLFLLVGLGLGIALLAELSPLTDLGFDNLYVVGPAATVTLATLLWGVVGARRYFAHQSHQVASLKAELEREIARGRQVQWQKNRVLANVLHGSLQAALNAGAIRISRATTEDEQAAVICELSADVTQILADIQNPRSETVSLQQTILRMTDTWEDITDIHWHIEENLTTHVAGQPVEQALSDVLVETVFNAIKHQSPKTIDVTMGKIAPGEIRLLVSHPGQLAATITPGLGTRTIEYVTVRHSLTESHGQVVFEGVFADSESVTT